MEAFDEVADFFADEEIDAAVPVLAGLAARTVARPLIRAGARRLSQPMRRQLVRGAARAVRTLAQRGGPRAVRALPRITRTVARQVVQRRLPVTAAPRALTRVAQRVAARPAVLRRVARPAARAARRGMRHIHLRGPVQITISGR
jgi:hypothetical protein